MRESNWNCPSPLVACCFTRITLKYVSRGQRRLGAKEFSPEVRSSKFASVKRFFLAGMMFAAGTLLLSTPVAAAPYCEPGQEPEFVLGFAFMKSQIGDVMGEPLECEHANPDNGDMLQQTSTGLSFLSQEHEHTHLYRWLASLGLDGPGACVLDGG